MKNLHPPSVVSVSPSLSPALRAMILGPMHGPMHALARRLASPFSTFSPQAALVAAIKGIR
jgi:hypothetical protein